jgi:peptide/nickel transport system substrate-binding protein
MGNGSSFVQQEIEMKDQALRVDTLFAAAANGSMSRRDLVKAASALGFGAAGIAALLNAPAVSAQGEVTLEFDAGATGGGGGKPNADITAYCWVINGGSQFEFFRMVDARLVTLSADLQDYVGDIADTWEIEGTTATFHLNPNATWHDGTPLTSRDVAFTINTVTDPATISRWGGAFKSIVGYEEAQTATTPTSLSGITTPDDQTLVIELTQPDAGLLVGLFWLNIMPEHLLGTVDRATIAEDPYWTQTRISAGPYKFVQLVEGERLELEANPDYHLGAPVIPKINLLFFQSPETSLAAFQEGTSLAAPMTVNDLELVEGIEGAEIFTTSAGVGSLQINPRQTEFADKRVRQAFAYAIDKATISETLFLGYADAVSTEVPYVEWAQPADANPYDYDPEMAMSLLEEAGWDSSKTFTLWYYYPDQVTATVMEAIQQYLEAVGIMTELRFDDGSGIRAQEFEEGTWQLGYGAFGAQTGPSNLSLVWGPPGFATWGFSNEEFDAEMEAALRTYDQDEQATHYQAAIKILNEECPWVWLFNRQNLIAVNTSRLTTGDSPAWGPGHLMYMNHPYDWTVTE